MKFRQYFITVLVFFINFSLVNKLHCEKYDKGFFKKIEPQKMIFNETLLKENKSKDFISKEEVLQDLQYVIYFLKYGYSGYEFYSNKNHFSWDNYFDYLIKSVNEKEQMSTKEFAVLLSSLTKDYIEDAHFRVDMVLNNGDKKTYRNIIHWGAYQLLEGGIAFSNCIMPSASEILKKQILLHNGKVEKIDIILSKNKLSVIECKTTDGKLRKIKTKPIIENGLNKNEIFEEKEISKETYYIAIHSFDPSHPNEMHAFIDSSNNAIKYQNIIFDIRNNTGGDDSIFTQWLINVTSGSYYYPSMIEVKSLASTILDYNKEYQRLAEMKENTTDKNEIEKQKRRLMELDKIIKKYIDKKQYFISENKYSNDQSRIKVNLGKNKYEGNIFILVNEWSYSASELIAYIAKQFSNIKTVGTNTAGMNSFGNVSPVILPNSRLIYNLPTKVFYYNETKTLAEGKGIYPKIWVNGDALNETLSLIK